MTKILLRALLASAALLAASPTLAAAPTSADMLTAAKGRLPQLLTCLRQQKVALVGAHRGGPLPEFPENVVATMQRTTALVPAFIETDVQQTSDGVLFQNHDDVLDRNTTGKGAIRTQTWAEISKLKVRDTTAYPTTYAPALLSEVLGWADGKALILLDVKPQTDPDLLMAEVDKAKAGDRVFFLSYTVAQALGQRQRRPDAVIALPVFDRDMLAKAKAAGLLNDHLIAMVRPGKMDAAFIPELEAMGVTVMSGTYGGPETPDAVYRTPADAGAFQALAKAGPRMIVSNRPVEAATALLADPTYARKLKACGVGH
ncbi:glycerophosphodiester phosphodiesterase family protein [Caulobacter sp.]|uniref:glycerophosphodiester phosphodiesterase family protein n=1 Tax=Caulobacter sp. TaxID=78 RepID=UPI003BAD0876